MGPYPILFASLQETISIVQSRENGILTIFQPGKVYRVLYLKHHDTLDVIFRREIVVFLLGLT